MMEISCDCASFKAELLAFPKNSPGRLVCYCDDCQSYLQKLGRADLLDEFGGTEVIPVYPDEIKFLCGAEHLKCNRLDSDGMDRWSTTCCNSPVANTPVGMPWAGILHQTFTREAPAFLQTLGEVRSRVYGKYARDGAPFSISNKIGFGDLVTVIPFMIKGKVFRKHLNSPFLQADGITTIRTPEVL